MSEVATSKRMAIDHLEAIIIDGPPVHIPIVHRFPPGLYVRECQMPAGALLTSMEHITEHPFFILKGSIIVSSDNEGEVRYDAPFIGLTLPNTKRALFALCDTTWVTVHANPDNITDPDEMVRRITKEWSNPIIGAKESERIGIWKKDSKFSHPETLIDV